MPDAQEHPPQDDATLREHATRMLGFVPDEREQQALQTNFAATSPLVVGSILLLGGSFLWITPWVIAPLLSNVSPALGQAVFNMNPVIAVAAVAAVGTGYVAREYYIAKNAQYSTEEFTPRRDTYKIRGEIQELGLSAIEKASLLHIMVHQTDLSEEGGLRMDDLARIVVALHKEAPNETPQILATMEKQSPPLISALEIGLNVLSQQMARTPKRIKKISAEYLGFPDPEDLEAVELLVSRSKHSSTQDAPVITKEKSPTIDPSKSSSFQDRVKNPKTTDGRDHTSNL